MISSTMLTASSGTALSVVFSLPALENEADLLLHRVDIISPVVFLFLDPGFLHLFGRSEAIEHFSERFPELMRSSTP
jgi:hypothetical protein